MLNMLLQKSLLVINGAVIAVFGFIVWLDLINVLFGPIDEILYGLIVAFLIGLNTKLKKMGRAGQL